MTPEAQRIAIAEACGWKWYRRPATGPWAAKPHRSLYHPILSAEYVSTLQPADMTERQCNEMFMWREGFIPDYVNDLNAMLGAESDLSNLDHQKLCLFLHKSIMGTLDNFDVNGNCNLECVSRVVKTTATQRAEAFLRALGKWEDS